MPLLLLLLAGPLPCQPIMTPVSVRGPAYLARLTLSPSCPTTAVFRVRKSSTTSLKRSGAPYQPIKPLTGAWEIRKTSTTIPAAELWSLSSWQWQFWNGKAWTPIRSHHDQPT